MGNFTPRGRSDQGRGGSRFGGNSGGGSGFGGGRGFSGGNRGFNDRGADRPMFQATCAECGNSCDVPFRPNGNKPVYCRDCFAQINNGPTGSADNRGSNRRSGGRDFDQRGNNAGIGGKSAEHIDQQFAQLNEKLDRILKRLTPSYARLASAEDAEVVAPDDEKSPETEETEPKPAPKKKRKAE